MSEDSHKLQSSPPSPKRLCTGDSDKSELVIGFNTDIAEISKQRRSLNEREKYSFDCHHFTPELDYKFPKDKSRSFQHQYLRKYKWLRYSRQDNGGYCLPCVLFPTSTDARKGKGTFVDTAFTNFKKAYEMCDNHAERHYHKDAVTFCDGFVKRMSGTRESVAVQFQRDLSHSIQTNKQKLGSIVETVVLCGRQNIPLRGHHDSGTDVEHVQSIANHGKFRALLNFRISAGDTVPKRHLETAGRNAIYTSPDIQNQIINILRDQICEAILSEVRDSLCYTLIADEGTDCSNKEEICIILRYVEPMSCQIKVNLVAFLECHSGVAGDALSDTMLKFLNDHLDLTKLRGQAIL